MVAHGLPKVAIMYSTACVVVWLSEKFSPGEGEMQEDIVFRAILTVLAIALFLNHRYHGTQFEKSKKVVGVIEVGLPIAASVWTISLILYIIGFKWFAFTMPIASGVRWVGVAAMTSCIPLSVWVYRTLGAHFSMKLQLLDHHQLVNSGAYRYVRHPMYATFFLCAIATILITAHYVVAVTGAVTALFMVLRIRNEEAMLLERFGDEYRAYQETTGALMPKLRIL